MPKKTDVITLKTHSANCTYFISSEIFCVEQSLPARKL